MRLSSDVDASLLFAVLLRLEAHLAEMQKDVASAIALLVEPKCQGQCDGAARRAGARGEGKGELSEIVPIRGPRP